MNIFVALDSKNGMMLNHRRQSRDSELIKKMMKLVGDNNANLKIYPFSMKLFKDFGNEVQIGDNWLKEGEENDFIFIEDKHLSAVRDRINVIYVFRWNRDYLSDFDFDVDLSEFNEELIDTFVGTSHERIDLFKYTKKEA